MSVDLPPLDPLAVDWALSPVDGDLMLVEGEAIAAHGLDAIVQLCRLYLSLWRGEWFWSTAEGIPMLETVLARGTPLEDIKAVFNQVILRVPGVRQVVSLTVDRNNAARMVNVAFVAKTDAGELRSDDYAPFLIDA